MFTPSACGICLFEFSLAVSVRPAVGAASASVPASSSPPVHELT